MDHICVEHHIYCVVLSSADQSAGASSCALSREFKLTPYNILYHIVGLWETGIGKGYSKGGCKICQSVFFIYVGLTSSTIVKQTLNSGNQLLAVDLR